MLGNLKEGDDLLSKLELFKLHPHLRGDDSDSIGTLKRKNKVSEVSHLISNKCDASKSRTANTTYRNTLPECMLQQSLRRQP